MTRWFSLRVRIYLILAALVLITLLGGLVMVWYTYRMEILLTRVMDDHLSAFQVAEALETALVNQKGFVTYYFQDGDPDWLRQLGEYRQIFRERLDEAANLGQTQQERAAVERIASEYFQYVTAKDQVIAHYRAGEREAGGRLHKQVRSHFFKILDLCEHFKGLHRQRLDQVREESLTRAKNLRIAAATALLAVLLLGSLLAFVLLRDILGPVRRLALETDRKGGGQGERDEVRALLHSVRGLIENVDYTQTELERSRESLLQAEKMALVGRLAAGTAHSIRNPLTSVKMRLFSLNRTLDLSPAQREDFDVIAEEIRHIDTIVQNFLEFSRAPRLKMRKLSPSEVVDAAIQLLKHRLLSYEVKVKVHRNGPMPETQLDPEQLKEVLVNLIVNACEAMEGGGAIEIHEEEVSAGRSGRMAVLRLKDNGPGIPEEVHRKVFEPFFSTKEQGTGLGLSIALRIIQEHGGSLELTSARGEGATFTITLPLQGARS